MLSEKTNPCFSSLLKEEQKDRYSQVPITSMASVAGVAPMERLERQLCVSCLGLRASGSSVKDEGSSFEVCLTLACKQVSL